MHLKIIETLMLRYNLFIVYTEVCAYRWLKLLIIIIFRTKCLIDMRKVNHYNWNSVHI